MAGNLTRTHAELVAIAGSLLRAAGANDRVALQVATHLADNELLGVPSMGLIRVVKYVQQIRTGYIVPNAAVTTVRDLPSLIHLDGGKGFGIVAFEEATKRAVDKAKQSAIAVAMVVNVAHTCRIGAFSEEAARRGCFAMVLGGGGHRRYKEVAPYGGRHGVFDTNPYAFAMPAGSLGPVSADFATSATAQGKMLVYKTARQPVPAGWIIDSQGRPTQSAEDFYQGGAMLPAAGAKGYGMAMIAELVGDAMLGEPHEFNWMMVVVDIQQTRDIASYTDAAQSFLAQVKECPPAEGFTEVLLPGEPERRTKARLQQVGIPVPEGTKELVNAVAKELELQPIFPH